MKFFATCLTTLILLAGVSSASAEKTVRFDTVLGIFEIELFETDAPLHTANFIDNYVIPGEYDDSFIHRRAEAATGLEVIQGGGFTLDAATDTVGTVPGKGTVTNEFSPLHSNVRGTLALARPPAGIDSGENEWFINLIDNSAALDPQSFTVFGQVTSGMDVVDAIAALPVFDGSSIHPAFGELPLRNNGANIISQGPPGFEQDLVLINSVVVLPDPPGTPVAPVPEPTAILLGCFGLVAFLAYGWRNRRSA